MVRTDDLDELARVLEWGEAADNYVLLLGDLLCNRLSPQDTDRFKRATKAALKLLADIDNAKAMADTAAFDRLSVYFAGTSLSAQTPPGQKTDLDRLTRHIGDMQNGEEQTIKSWREHFEQIAEVMHLKAREISRREPAFQF